MEALKKAKKFSGPAGPVVLVIMDGIGIGKHEDGDYVRAASTPTMDWLKANAVHSQLKAHGRAVGLPSDEDMGNSEVGHNAIGCGRVFEQGAQLVNNAMASRSIFEGAVWKELIANCKAGQSTLHFIGLLSDGNVHSHIDQLKGMLNEAAAEGIARVCLHPLLDGRDVPPTSALTYIDDIEAFFKEKNAAGKTQFLIASGGGRMVITMDRYNANWGMVELGWKTHVKGEGRFFASAREAIETFRNEKPGIIDQDLPPFVIEADGKAAGPIVDGDSVVFFNFRGDRAIEITNAFENDEFTHFDRGTRPKVKYAGMMEYDGDLHIPKKYLVTPPAINRTLDEYLIKSGISQLAISETQKFGHVTYFFNGNRSGKFSDTLEEYVEVPSDIVPFEQRPWMKGAEITDRVVAEIAGGKYKFIRLNYPNGDMVGHTGNFEAVRIAVEAVDLCLARLIEAVKKANGIMVISADHGNADDMYERSKKTGKTAVDPFTGGPQAKTSHSLNPVPVYIYAPANKAQIRLSDAKDLGIASLAATCIKLLGFEPPADYAPGIVDAG